MSKQRGMPPTYASGKRGGKPVEVKKGGPGWQPKKTTGNEETQECIHVVICFEVFWGTICHIPSIATLSGGLYDTIEVRYVMINII